MSRPESFKLLSEPLWKINPKGRKGVAFGQQKLWTPPDRTLAGLLFRVSSRASPRFQVAMFGNS